MARELLDETGLSAITGIPLGTLRNWRSQRVGPDFFKLGNAVRYDMSDVELWIEGNRKATKQGAS